MTDVLSFPTLDGIRNKVITKEDGAFNMDGKFIHIGSIAICYENKWEHFQCAIYFR